MKSTILLQQDDKKQYVYYITADNQKKYDDAIENLINSVSETYYGNFDYLVIEMTVGYLVIFSKDLIEHPQY